MILVLVLFAVLASYIGPSLHVFEQWRESRSAEQQLATLKAENERLARQAREIEQPEVAMTEARRLGLVGPGERAYVVHGLE